MVEGTSFTLSAPDGAQVFVHTWPLAQARGAVLVLHGLAEHAARYDRFARALNAAAYAVYAPDHRAHGRTAPKGKIGWAADDAWNKIVADAKAIADRMRSDHPEVPLFVIGHSMGSVIAQRFIELHGAMLAGAVLSGTFGSVPQLAIVAGIARAASWGRHDMPSILQPRMFADFNQGLPARTGFEWLSRDDAEVQRYVDDPWCGFALSNGFIADMLAGFAVTWKRDQEARIPADLPVLMVAGAVDPAGTHGASVSALAERYRARGIRSVDVTLYPGARHEVLNETNREEVQNDIVAWLNVHDAAATAS